MRSNNKIISRLRKLALASSVALYGTVTYADANLQGRVTDSNNKAYFEGALVQIKELNLSKVSERDGSFRFNNLPSGSYTLVVDYLGAEKVEYPVTIANEDIIKNFAITSQSGSELEEIIVFGQSASQASALNQQKHASSLKTIVSSDSVGQFPDQNVAEALQRLPGIFIARDQGEGRFVGIRGIDPNLNNLTINGTNIPSPDSGNRSVAMDVIPSELIEGLEVSKSVTPDMDADAIGGSIEVKSLTAFDREDDSYSMTAQTSYNELFSETSPKLSGSYSKILDLDSGGQLGIAAAFSWFKRDFGSHNMETDGGWIDDLELEDINSGEDVERLGPEEIEQRSYVITRERTGFAVNLDYHATPTDKYYLRSLYSEFSDDEYRTRNEYKFEDGDVDASTWTDSNISVFGAEMDRDTKDRYEEQKIVSIVVGGENILDTWTVEYNLGYSISKEAEPNRLDVSFAGENIDMGYTSTGPIPNLSVSASGLDLSNFELDDIEFVNNLTEDEEVSFRIDLSKDFTWNNNNGEFKFGGKIRSREKFNDSNMIVYDGGFDDATAALFETASPEYSLGNFGPGISRSGIRSWFASNRNSFEINQLDSDIESQGGTFQSEEDIAALYGMVTLDIDNWHIVAGVRYESTDFSTRGNRVEYIVDEIADTEEVVVTPWAVDKDYDYTLPSLNVRYDITDKLLARFALTQTIARPSFEDSAAFQLIESETVDDDGEIVTEIKAEVGNPDLDPYESNNIDLSVEYYPGQIGVFSVGYFNKSIDNFIVMAEVQDNGLWDGFEEVVQPINGGSVDLDGWEIAWVKTFDNGFLVSANGTFSDADELLPNQSDSVSNLVLGYENNHISTRLTLSQRSEAFHFYDNDKPVFEDSTERLDFNFKYFITDKTMVYFNAINITDEPFYFYHGSRQYNYQYEIYGSSFEIGFTMNSF